MRTLPSSSTFIAALVTGSTELCHAASNRRIRASLHPGPCGLLRGSGNRPAERSSSLSAKDRVIGNSRQRKNRGYPNGCRWPERHLGDEFGWNGSNQHHEHFADDG